MVFFGAQTRVQADQLSVLPVAGNLLIVGGGSGWILEEIARRVSSPLDIQYVESSAEMLARARKRDPGVHRVLFIHLPIADFEGVFSYDAVITPFLFDNFSEEEAMEVFNHIHHQLLPGGYWLFSDFSADHARASWWQRAMLVAMYDFFRVVADVRANGLVEMHTRFLAAGYRVEQDKGYYGRFIRGTVYRRKGTETN